MLVALIDDQLDIVESLEDILLGEGYGVISFTNAADAADYLQQHRVDAALVDRNMPDMDGFTLITSMRHSPANRRTPIAIVTGLSDSDSMRLAFEHGANFFMPKPITAEELRSVLNRCQQHC